MPPRAISTRKRRAGSAACGPVLAACVLLMACRDPVVPDLPEARWTAISAGSFHTCGVVEGRAFCWGLNQTGQLGGGPGVILGALPVPVRVAGDDDFEQVLPGGFHTCGLGPVGATWCWGRDGAGELGQGDAFEPESCYGWPCSSRPRTVAGLGTVRKVSVGFQFGCALGEGGDVLCWGRNNLGQLGTGGSGGHSDVPMAPALPEIGGYVDLTAGRDHACALAADGATYCWGQNEHGQLGRAAEGECPVGDTAVACSPIPARAADGLAFVEIAAGGTHTCGLPADGTLRCWGGNDGGQLGRLPLLTNDVCGSDEEPSSCSLEPVEVSGGIRFASVSLGARHTCGLDLARRGHCWGRNLSGQVGNCLIDVFVASPEPVCGGHRFTQISAGSGHTCAVSVDDDAFCWGGNDQGQLGSGFQSLGPVRVPPPPGFR